MHNQKKYTYSLIILLIGLFHYNNSLQARLNFVNRSSTFIINDNPYSMMKVNQIGGIIGWSQESITKEHGNNNPSNWRPIITAESILGSGGVPVTQSFIVNNSNAINALAKSVRNNSNAITYLNRTSSNTIYQISINSGGGGASSVLVRTMSNALLYANRVTSNAFRYCCRTSSNAINSAEDRTDKLEVMSLIHTQQIRLNSNAFAYCCRVSSNAINALQIKVSNIHEGGEGTPPEVAEVPEASDGSVPGIIIGVRSKAWSTIGFPLVTSHWTDDGQFLAVGGKAPDEINDDLDVDPEHELRIYQFDNTTDTLTGLTSKDWSTIGNSIQTVSWFRNASSGDVFLAVAGKIPDVGGEVDTINNTHALRIYQFNPTAPVIADRLIGVVSKPWALSGEPINSVSWIQDSTTNRVFLAVGGDSPSSGSETNINANHELRIYEFLPNASVIDSRLVGVTSKDWSTVGNPIKSVQWIQDTVSKRIFLAVGGENPNAQPEDNINSVHGLRIYEFAVGTPTSTLTGVVSKNWSSFGAPVNTVAWTQDLSTSRMLLGIGGENPNSSDGDPKIRDTHEFRLYEFIPGTTIFSSAALTGITSKNWSTQGFPVYTVAWSSDSRFITVGGGLPNSKLFTKDFDPNINATHEIRLFSFDVTDDSLLGVGSKNWSTIGNPVFTLSWNPLEFLFAAGGSAPNTDGGDPLTIFSTHQLRLYRLPEDISGSSALLKSILSKKKGKKKNSGNPSVGSGIGGGSAFGQSFGPAGSEGAGPAGEGAGAGGEGGAAAAAAEKAKIDSGGTKDLIKDDRGRQEDEAAEKVVKLLGTRKLSKASNVLFGLTSKAWTAGEDVINACVWSNDGEYVAIAGSGANTDSGDKAINPEHSLRIYRYDEGTKKLEAISSLRYGEDSSKITSLSFLNHNNNLYLAVGGSSKESAQETEKKELKIYAFNKAKKVFTECASRNWSAKTGYILTLAWHPKSPYLAVGGLAADLNDDDTNIEKNNELRIYFFDPSKKDPKDRLEGISSKPWSSKRQAIRKLAWNNTGTMLAVAGKDPNENNSDDVNFQLNHEIRVYSFDPNAGEKLSSVASAEWAPPKGVISWVNTIAWSPDGNYLSVGGKCYEKKFVKKILATHEFKIFQFLPQEEVPKRLVQIASKGWNTYGNEIHAISWHRSGKFVAIGGGEPDLKDEDVRIAKGDAIRVYYFNPTNKDYEERLVGVASKPWARKGFPIKSMSWHPSKDLLSVVGKRPDANDGDTTTIIKDAEFRIYQLIDAPNDPILNRSKKGAEEVNKTLVGVTSKNWVTLGAVLKKTAWSNDGKYLATGGKLANATDNIETIKGTHKLRVYQFSGSSLVGMSSRPWSISENGINALAWSPNDSYLAVGGRPSDSPSKDPNIKTNDDLCIYSFDSTKEKAEERLTGVVSARLSSGDGAINDIVWSPDGKYMIVVGSFPQAANPGEKPTSSDEIKVFSFDPTNASVSQRLKLVSTKTVGSAAYAIAWAKNGTHIAVGYRYGVQIYKFDKKSLISAAQIVSNKVPSKITSIAWSPDSAFIVVGGKGSTKTEHNRNGLVICSFDPEKNTLKAVAEKKWRQSGDAVNSVTWNQDGEFIVAVGENSNVKEKGAKSKNTNALHVYHFDPSSSTLTLVDSKGWAKIGGHITSASWSPNGEYLTVSGKNPTSRGQDTNLNPHHELRLYRFKKTNTSFFTGTASKDWSKGTDPINSVSWDRDGRYLAVGGFKPNLKDKDETIDATHPVRIYEFDDTNSVLQAVASTAFNNIKEIDSDIISVAWHPTDDLLAVAERKINIKKITLGATVHIYRFDPKAKTLTLIGSKPYGDQPGSSIKAIAWSPDGTHIAIGGKNPTENELQFLDKDCLRIYKFKPESGQLAAVIGTNFGDGSCIDSMAWLEEEGDTFLAIGGSNMEKEVSQGKAQIDITKKEISQDRISGIKVFRFNEKSLIQIWDKEWSTNKATINVLSWSPNKLFLAAAGATSNISGDGIPSSQAFHLYFFDSKKRTFNGITSRRWATNTSAIRSLSWSANNLFLAMGGETPNLADKDKNINQNNEFRLYFFDAFNMEGIVSRDWSSLGFPLKNVAWHKSGKFIVLAGQKPTAFDGAPNNHELQLYRFNAGTAIPHTLKDALQKTTSTTSIVLSRANGEYWCVDRGTVFFFDGVKWETARIEGSIKNPGHNFITEGERNTLFALDDKGVVHKATTVSTGPAIINWKPLTPVGQKVVFMSLTSVDDTLYGMGEDKRYYQYNDRTGWKQLAAVPEPINRVTKAQHVMLNFICTGNICRKRGVLEGFAP